MPSMTRRLPLPLRMAALFMFSAIPGYCSLMVYSAADGEAIFNRVAPGLPKQNFTSALVSPGGETTCDGPITSNTANSCFPSGSLLPGVEYRASSGLLAAYGTNWNNRDNSTPIFGVNNSDANLELTFQSPVTAAAFFYAQSGILSSGEGFGLSVFSPTGTLLISTGDAVGIFIGIVSDADRIGKISITSGGSGPFPAAIDFLSFGVPRTATPEPDTWALLGAGLLGAGLWRRYRRSSAWSEAAATAQPSESRLQLTRPPKSGRD